MRRRKKSARSKIKVKKNQIKLEPFSAFQKSLLIGWIVRLLDEFEGWRLLALDEKCIHADEREILEFIGFQVDDESPSRQEMLDYLEECREEGFVDLDSSAGDGDILVVNSREIAKQLNLSRIEEKILIFAVLLHRSCALENMLDCFGFFNLNRTVALLAGLFQVPEPEVRSAFSREGRLYSSSLVQLDLSNSDSNLKYEIDLLPGLAEVMLEPDATLETILATYFHLAAPARLEVEDYRHIAEDFQMIHEHLRCAGMQGRTGVNVLIYGPPGTGKSELSALLAQELGWQLYAINTDSKKDKSFTRGERLRALRLAQSFLGHSSKKMILFDEADSQLTQDVSFLFDGNGVSLKATVNQILEQNEVPTIWIANALEWAEPAYLRRFDIILHHDWPPRSVRLRILQRYFTGLPVDDLWLEQLAENRCIAPAVVEKIAGVARSWSDIKPVNLEKRLEKLFASVLEVMGYALAPLRKRDSRLPYRLTALNPDHDLTALVEGVKKRKEGRFCFYGPPGTGKSDFARYLARELDQPLLIKRASDLISPFVGQTEAAIAGMFKEAVCDNAVLLLDEADGFLRDRRLARNIWEVTQVNELLTQIEAYSGIFICTTNIMDNLDDASLRRFDLKIKFDYLKPEQAWKLFQALLQKNGSDETPDMRRNGYDCLKHLHDLTPGDFAAANRRLLISGQPLTSANLAKALAHECAMKKGQFGAAVRIGF
jgi:SpoVK/Ycf46/Vps4 family AAA+-type ATPase